MNNERSINYVYKNSHFNGYIDLAMDEKTISVCLKQFV